MRRYVTLFLLFCASMGAQNPILDTWTALRNQFLVPSSNPLVTPGNTVGLSTVSGKLRSLGDKKGGGYYDIVSIVDQGPGATPPSPFWSGDCGSDGSTYRCYVITFAQPQDWVTDSVTNLSMRSKFWVFHNLQFTGASCSMAAWNAYSDHTNSAPVMSSMIATSPGDKKHIWFQMRYDYAGTFDTTNCTFVSGSIYNNCSTSCGNSFFFQAYPFDSTGRVAAYTESGTFNDAVHNRMNFAYVPTGAANFIQDPADRKEVSQFGGYEGPLTNSSGDAGRHYYGSTVLDVIAGRKIYASLTRRYDHIPNGYPSGEPFPYDYGYKQGFGRHLFGLMTYFYFSATGSGFDSGWILSRTDVDFDQITYSTAPDAGWAGIINTPYWMYTGNVPALSTTGRYQASVHWIKNINGVLKTRYSTSDMYSAGWSAGAAGPDVTATDLNNIHRVWNTPDIAEASMMHLAMRPGVQIGYAYTGPGGDTMVTVGATTPSVWVGEMLYNTGDHVNVSGVNGCTNANGNWAVTVLPSKSYRTITYPSGNTGPHNNAGDFSLTVSGGVATVTDLRGPHGLSVGRIVKWISSGEWGSCGPASCGGTPFLATAISEIPDSTHFKFPFKYNDGSAVPDGTYDPAVMGGLLYVFEANELTGSGPCTTFSSSPLSIMIATDDTRNFLQLDIPLQATSPAVSPGSLPAGTVGAAYSQSLTAANFSTAPTWSVLAGTLPAGLSLGTCVATTSCSIAGTPTTTTGSPFSFTIRATNGTDTVDTPYTVTIGPPVGTAGSSRFTGKHTGKRGGA